MKSFKINILLFSLFSGILLSCSKTDEDVVDLGYNYYPVEIGNYIKYDVVEYVYDDFNNTTDTAIYQLLELIDTSYIDGEGRTAFKLSRFTKGGGDDLGPWKLKDVWTVYKGSDRIERTEENVTYVPMTFPLRRGNTWDGNSRNDSASQTYRVLDYDLKNTIGGQVFERTTRINHKENINLIEDQLVEEIYARNIGLIQRVQRDITIDPDDNTKAGYEYFWVYAEHGKL